MDKIAVLGGRVWERHVSQTVHVCTCVSARACACVHLCARVCVSNEKASFSIFSLSP